MSSKRFAMKQFLNFIWSHFRDQPETYIWNVCFLSIGITFPKHINTDRISTNRSLVRIYLIVLIVESRKQETLAKWEISNPCLRTNRELEISNPCLRTNRELEISNPCLRTNRELEMSQLSDLLSPHITREVSTVSNGTMEILERLVQHTNVKLFCT